jgi:RNA polymerase sigma-70 factor, ECF subfamily
LLIILSFARPLYAREKSGELLSALPQIATASVPGHFELEEAYRTYHVNVFRAAYQITGNAADAEDVLQTVFLRLWNREADASEVTNMRSYLYRSAINAALDLLRARQSDQTQPLEEASAVSHTRNDEDLILRAWLRAALSKLKPRHAEMFVLRYIQEFDNREIATLFNTSHAVVAITLFRIRKQLQRDYEVQMRTSK